MCVWLFTVATGLGQPITVIPPFHSNYSIKDLGAVTNGTDQITGPYGGICFQAGAADHLLIGTTANSYDAAIYSVKVRRGTNGSVIGLTNDVQFVSKAYGTTPLAGGGIDGGLAYGPNNVLFFTSYPDNRLGQIRPGGAVPAKLIDLNTLGIGDSVGGLAFVPPGFPGEGSLKLLSYNLNTWHSATISPDGNGTYNVSTNGKVVQLNGGIEGAFYVKAGNPAFARDSVLVAEYGSHQISAYEIDGNGDPLPLTRRTFVANLPGATGAALDPTTGDFLFGSFGADHLYVVNGFTLDRPAITLTSPADNTTNLCCNEIKITATVIPAAGAVTNIAFYDGPLFIGQLTNAPYTLFYGSSTGGLHVLTALATDIRGVSSTSSPINVTISGPSSNRLVASYQITNGLRVCFNGLPGSNYVFEMATNVQAGANWIPLLTNSVPSGYLIFTESPATNAAQRYYRVLSP